MGSIVLQVLLSYLASLAASLRSEDIIENHKKRLNECTEKEWNELFAIQNIKSLKEQLDQIAANAGKIMDSLEMKDPIQKAVFELLSDLIFRENLVKWLCFWALPESRDSEKVLKEQISQILIHNRVDEREIEEFKNNFFNLVENLVFQDAKLSGWRHKLCLQAIKMDTGEILHRMREQGGEYSEKTINQSLIKYRELCQKTCDIIDLAGLPEEDRHLAVKNFILRQLYIPLRVKVEPIHVSKEDSNEDNVFYSTKTAEKEHLGMESRKEKEGEDRKDKRIPIGKLLRSKLRIVLLGDPGGGKTTLTRWLTISYILKFKNNPDFAKLPDVTTLPDKDFLPILIRCRDLPLDAHNSTIEEIIGRAVRMNDVEESLRKPLKSAFLTHLENGTALLMIDGLDEIQDSIMRARFSKRIETLATLFEKAPILVTSRIFGYKEMGFRLGEDFLHTSITRTHAQRNGRFCQTLGNRNGT